MPVVIATVADGSLVCVDGRKEAEQAIGRELEWFEDKESITRAGTFYQATWVAEINDSETHLLTHIKEWKLTSCAVTIGK